ncbi:unnamed protein product [Meloidogyne enterolobii]|uniref:Uncharacterized protein n=1 Tax=Meloidogyne enterolobii TaxID=390850 RepID=A0ACB1A234_MELEN
MQEIIFVIPIPICPHTFLGTLTNLISFSIFFSVNFFVLQLLLNFQKMLFSLPTEVQLDIFKLFNYEELCSIRQTNLYFRDFINKFEGELAREKLHSVSIDHFSNTLSKQIDYKLIKSKNFDFAFFAERHKEVNEQIEQKWSDGLQNPIPLYLSAEGLKSFNVFIFIDEGNLFFR